MLYQFLSILYKFEMDTSGQFFIVKLPDLKLLDPIFEDSPGWFFFGPSVHLVFGIKTA